jgi:hypothetical protein
MYIPVAFYLPRQCSNECSFNLSTQDPSPAVPASLVMPEIVDVNVNVSVSVTVTVAASVAVTVSVVVNLDASIDVDVNVNMSVTVAVTVAVAVTMTISRSRESRGSESRYAYDRGSRRVCRALTGPNKLCWILMNSGRFC